MKFTNKIFLCISLFLSSICYSQSNIYKTRKIVKVVDKIIIDTINIDSVVEFYVEIPESLENRPWKSTAVIDFDTGDTNIYEELIPVIVVLPDSIFIYKNLDLIIIGDPYILPIFPKTIRELDQLRVIVNEGLINEDTYKNTSPLKNLTEIILGKLTREKISIPKVLTSGKLQEVTFYIDSLSNIESMLNIIEFLLEKESIKKVIIVRNIPFALTKKNDAILKSFREKYLKMNKKLILYF